MSTMLRRVLEAFEKSSSVVSLPVLSRELGIEPNMLHSMIDHWVRKGRIKPVYQPGTASECRACNVEGGCPFAPKGVFCYILNTSEDKDAESSD